jgi:galactofuranose transport system substrate-binding protein
MSVGFIQSGSESGWRAANTSYFMELAVQKGITFNMLIQPTLEGQLAALYEYAADPTVNVIVLAPVQSTGYDRALAAAKAAGKLVVIEDVPIDSDPSLYVTFVGSDTAAQGRMAAEALCKGLAGRVSRHVAEITGPAGHPISVGRSAGFREGMTACGIDIPAGLSRAGDWSVDGGQAAMAAMLTATRDIQGVVAASDEESIGAIKAIKAAGLKPGKDIVVVGFGLTADGVKYMVTDQMYADVERAMDLATPVYGAALKALNGATSIPKWVKPEEKTYLKADIPECWYRGCSHY